MFCPQHLFPSTPLPMAWLLATLLTPAAALSQAALPTQTLPIRAQVCGPVLGERQHQPPASICVALEVPDTPQEYSIGLMGRSRLLPERGMWFRFDQQEAGFWMRNVLIPLDLVFLEQYDPHPHGNGNDDPVGMLLTARIVKVAHDVPPCRAMPCPTYGAGQPVDHVVELAAGEARRRNWTEGTLVDFSWLQDVGGENDRSQSTRD